MCVNMGRLPDADRLGIRVPVLRKEIRVVRTFSSARHDSAHIRIEPIRM